VLGVECHFVPSIVSLSNYMVETNKTEALFVGSNPQKGLEIAFRIAEIRPDIPFRFVESWPMSDEFRRHCEHRSEKAGNISWNRSVLDMRQFYEKARILLAPSVCEDSHARVVAEAQVSGIPVLGSNRGGMPEAIGNGGMLVDVHAPIGAWLASFDRMWADEEEYMRLSEQARRHTQRPELAPRKIANEFVGHIENFLRERRS
jgi:glycosyltransferase involved in cell wall biosynthesis